MPPRGPESERRAALRENARDARESAQALSNQARQAQKQAAALHAASRPVRVLVADDDASFLHMMRVRLSSLPTVELVGEATDGRQAVELALTLRPDVVLLDCAMPVMDGFAAAEAIREALPETRLFLQSGEMTPENGDRADRVGLPLHDKLRFHGTVASLLAARRDRRTADQSPPVESSPMRSTTYSTSGTA